MSIENIKDAHIQIEVPTKSQSIKDLEIKIAQAIVKETTDKQKSHEKFGEIGIPRGRDG